MDEAVLREKVGEILSEVQRLPTGDTAGGRTKPVNMIPSPGSAIRREMAAIEDCLDHVRLAIKYLVFDLEATKRENRLLREMLDDA